jgi:hypothetical protein
MALLPASATSAKRALLWSTEMPVGEEKCARLPTPSASRWAFAEDPTTVVTRQLVVSTLRMALLPESATSTVSGNVTPSGKKSSPAGFENCARHPTPSDGPWVPIIPAPSSTSTSGVGAGVGGVGNGVGNGVGEGVGEPVIDCTSTGYGK